MISNMSEIIVYSFLIVFSFSRRLGEWGNHSTVTLTNLF